MWSGNALVPTNGCSTRKHPQPWGEGGRLQGEPHRRMYMCMYVHTELVLDLTSIHSTYTRTYIPTILVYTHSHGDSQTPLLCCRRRTNLYQHVCSRSHKDASLRHTTTYFHCQLVPSSTAHTHIHARTQTHMHAHTRTHTHTHTLLATAPLHIIRGGGRSNTPPCTHPVQTTIYTYL